MSFWLRCAKNTCSISPGGETTNSGRGAPIGDVPRRCRSEAADNSPRGRGASGDSHRAVAPGLVLASPKLYLSMLRLFHGPSGACRWRVPSRHRLEHCEGSAGGAVGGGPPARPTFLNKT